jgi:Cu+-exporting ATPase
MEKHSSHPIARSIVSALPNTTATVLIEVTEIAGEGIRATDDKGNKLKLSGYYQEETGYYGVELYVNDVMSCRMLLSDEIKTNTVSLIHTLSLKDITTILLSGDKEARVKQLASETGISQYFAEQKPDDKVKCILELKKNGPVMMVGDGINDAPALAAADVGISMAAQSGITTDAAQIVLLNNKIESLTDAIDISRLTYSTIKQNLFWAFIYNVVAIPLAAAGFLSPMLGAAAMAFSDLVVIGNSLLLRYKRLR